MPSPLISVWLPYFLRHFGFFLLFDLFDSFFMLSPNFRYLTFDFETTWLDTRKDEPIQIGIVEFDHEFNILSTYTSLIKPKKNIKELKSIVQHVTWFSLDQLEDAPSMEDILPDIISYFSDTSPTVVIGQNISFDLAILKRYLHRTPLHIVDTYIYSKALLHYVPSYSLETLNEYLKKSNNHRQPKNKEQEGSAHDALYDCFLAYNLFEKLITKIQHLRKKHLLVDLTLEKNTWVLWKIIHRSKKEYDFKEKRLFFPPLHTSISSSHKKIIQDTYIDLDQIQKKETWNISTLSPKLLLHHINRWKKKRILAVNHKAKVSLIERILKDMNFTPDTLHDQVIFDANRVDIFLKKDVHDDEESLFILKYHSQLDKWHTRLDINSLHEYKIFYSIAGQKKSWTSPLTVCTHDQLFTIQHSITKDHTILFLDKDRWYQSYQKVLKKSFDPLYLLNHIEQVVYKYKLLSHSTYDKIKDIYTLATFLIWITNIEINPFFSWSDIKKIEFNDISSHTRFPKTWMLLKKRRNSLENLDKHLLSEDLPLLEKCKNLLHYLTNPTTVSKRMYNWDKRYYTFQDLHVYVQRNEFTNALPQKWHLIFLSSSKQSHRSTTSTYWNKKWKKSPRDIAQKNITLPDTISKKVTTSLNVSTITKISDLIQHIQSQTSWGSFFCISSSKERSRSLFDEMVKRWLHTTYEICAENITWGVWKNLFRAKQASKNVILIWWYNFYLSALGQQIWFTSLILYHLHWALAPLIVNDLIWRKE